MTDSGKYEVNKTGEYAAWLDSLRDKRARIKLVARAERLEDGNFSNTRSVGEGVFEIKIDYGPGYRMYYMLEGTWIVLLLIGGDKSTQTVDIKRARHLKREIDTSG